MPDISTGIEVAWQIAAQEAVHGHHELILPAHVFIGVCSLDKVLAEENLSGEMEAALQPEWDALLSVFNHFELDPVTLRRSLRRYVGTGDCYDVNRTKVSRSQATRIIFARAAELVGDADTITMPYLMTALLDDLTGLPVQLLKKQGVPVDALRAASLALSSTLIGHRSSANPFDELEEFSGGNRKAGGPLPLNPHRTSICQRASARNKAGLRRLRHSGRKPSSSTPITTRIRRHCGALTRQTAVPTGLQRCALLF